MDAQTVIDSYVNEVAARLPRFTRNDVGYELRTLLTEELKAAATQAGRPPDEQLAIEVLQDFGQPEVVAAHYNPPGFALVEPEQAPIFVALAAIVVTVQWLLTLPRVFQSTMTFGEWAAGPALGAMSWVGLLVLWFAMATWIRRLSPVDPQTRARPWTHWIFWLPGPRTWRPVDHASDSRRLALRLIPLGALVTALFIAPSWWLQLLLPSGSNSSWAMYDNNFHHWILPPLLALMSARLLLSSTAVASKQRWAKTEGIRVVLWFTFVAMLTCVLFGWPIFANGLTNALFKAWLAIFLLVNMIQLIVWTRRSAVKVRTPGQLFGRDDARGG